MRAPTADPGHTGAGKMLGRQFVGNLEEDQGGDWGRHRVVQGAGMGGSWWQVCILGYFLPFLSPTYNTPPSQDSLDLPIGDKGT